MLPPSNTKPSGFVAKFGPIFNGASRVTAFLFMLAIFAPVQMYCLYRNIDSRKVSLLLYRVLITILGIRVRVYGKLKTADPVLYVCNHTSYLDIPVLGSLIPASFVAKSEVASWPLFGVLSKLQRTVFVIRQSTRAAEQSDGLRELLQKGRSLILFPEGTSTVGLSVLPFKSSLFSITQGDFPKPVLIQPVSLSCSGLDGMPMMRDLRPLYAWYGDMTLVPHLWNAFKMGRFTVDVIFHPPIDASNIPDRKKLAVLCHDQVAHGVELSLAGRGFEELEAPKETARLTAEASE